MINFIKKNLNDDRGDSEIISLIFVLPLLLAIFVSIFDGGFYINNRSTMQSAARDSARTVATMGGNGTATQGTPIEVKYGLSKTSACTSDMEKNVRVNKAFDKASMTPIECNLLKSIMNNTSLINVDVTKVKCGPEKTDGRTLNINGVGETSNGDGRSINESPKSNNSGGIGSSVYCSIQWKYNSIPGSPLSIFKGIGDNSTTGYAESDVDMSNIDLVDRPDAQSQVTR